MKTRFLLCGLALMTFASSLSAQPALGTPEPEPNLHFWDVTLPGGEYQVALSRITSVSRHKYLLDGALIVDEVTIDTVGQALARFYFIQPASSEASSTAAGKVLDKATERAQEVMDTAANRTGSDLQDMVVKKYPETTHARTIEYRILSEAQLTTLFESAKKAWETGNGKKLTIK